MPAAMMTVPGTGTGWDELSTRQPDTVHGGGPDRDSLLATPMSGARDLWGPS